MIRYLHICILYQSKLFLRTDIAPKPYLSLYAVIQGFRMPLGHIRRLVRTLRNIDKLYCFETSKEKCSLIPSSDKQLCDARTIVPLPKVELL